MSLAVLLLSAAPATSVVQGHAQGDSAGASVKAGVVSAEALERFVPRMRDAGAQLDHARRVKARLYSQPASSRAFWRKLAVEAYQAVRAFHPEDVPRGAEAAFRAGELLRTKGELEGALREFRWALATSEGVFSTRAALEIGHLYRRRGEWSRARETYLDVAVDASASAAHRDDAWLWCGRVWKIEGRADEARNAWRRVAEHGVNPLDRIRAYDLLGELWLTDDDIEAACGVLNECLQALAQAALEETAQGERVRNGMLRMRLVESLPAAIAGREGSRLEQVTSRNP